MIRASLRKYLLDNIAEVEGRIWPIALPEYAIRPAISFSRIAGGHDHNIKKSSGTAIGAFEIDCWSDTYEGADALAESVRQKLQVFGGDMGDTHVDACILDDEVDAYESPEDGSDRGIFRITLRYRIRHTVSIPNI